MLSAAEDIMDRQQNKSSSDSDGDQCDAKLDEPHCSSVSTGAVLLADIIPTLIIKLSFPFFMQKIPFGIRHLVVVLLQCISYFMVAFSTTVAMSLAGVAFASLGSGLGEISYLALSSHFPRSVISSWSSGTGGAGVIGSFAYAGLTEPSWANLSPKDALLVMLVIPIIFAFAYWFLMDPPDTVYQVNIFNPKTWIVPPEADVVTLSTSSTDKVRTESTQTYSNGWEADEAEQKVEKISNTSEGAHVTQRVLTMKEKLYLVLPLLKYMIPLSTVYLAEYLINQGLTELIYFDCSHGFHLSRHSQYRWYQVIYQVGVFCSRSSVNLFLLPQWVLYILPVLQLGNAILFTFDSIFFFVPHIGIIFGLIFFEGLLGGASYVNTFYRVHNEVAPDIREYSISIASSSDSFGIVISGFSAIPLHNYICSQQKYHIK
uniref:Battenin n=1 Tax=Panagrolaimus davidi TaxID=227884 RepID=A0A914PJR8_9BILA